MFAEILQKIAKSNDQRVKMALTLVQIMKQSKAVSIEARSAVAASLLDMLETDMLEEDKQLIQMINEGIDCVCEDAKQYGVDNLREKLVESINVAKRIVDEKIERVKMGDDILKSINLN